MRVESGEPFRTPIESKFDNHTAAAVQLEEMIAKGTLGNSDGFARSLIAAWKASKMSSKQIYWMHRLANDTPSKPADPPVEAIEFFNVATLFSTALKHLRFPRLRLGGSFIVKMSREREVGAFDNGVRIGTLKNGKLELTRAAQPHHKDKLVQLEKDPLGYARGYGLRTGSCMFCGLTLTAAESVGNSYGPICAENWDLPWADTDAARREKETRKLLALHEELTSQSEHISPDS